MTPHPTVPDSDADGVFASVLVIDIVNFSTLKMRDQFKAVITLTGCVRRSLDAVMKAETRESVIPLSTGDGWALAFFDPDHSATAVRCAFQLSSHLGEAQTSTDSPQIRIRSGVSSGRLKEFNETVLTHSRNAVGTAINSAVRIAEFGDAGHVLCSTAIRDAIKGVDEFEKTKMTTTYQMVDKHGEATSVISLVDHARNVGSELHPEKFCLWATRTYDLMVKQRAFDIPDKEVSWLLDIRVDRYVMTLYNFYRANRPECEEVRRRWKRQWGNNTTKN